MRRTKRLRKLRLALKGRLYRLEKRLTSVASSASIPVRDSAVAYVAIEALNAWALFSRSFYLSCAMGARTEKNVKISIAGTTTDYIGHAIIQYKRGAKPNAAGVWHRRDEPAWHDPNVLMTICKSLGCSNQIQIDSSFSLQQTVFRDLPVCRNFFAHRNESTSLAARNIAPRYTLPTYLSPAELLLSVSPGASTSLMLGWIDEMNVTAEFVCDA